MRLSSSTTQLNEFKNSRFVGRHGIGSTQFINREALLECREKTKLVGLSRFHTVHRFQKKSRRNCSITCTVCCMEAIQNYSDHSTVSYFIF